MDSTRRRPPTESYLTHPSTRKEVVHSPEKAKFIVTETVPEVCYEERTIPGNNRSEYQALNCDGLPQNTDVFIKKTTEKLVNMISGQEEL